MRIIRYLKDLVLSKYIWEYIWDIMLLRTVGPNRFTFSLLLRYILPQLLHRMLGRFSCSNSANQQRNLDEHPPKFIVLHFVPKFERFEVRRLIYSFESVTMDGHIALILYNVFISPPKQNYLYIVRHHPIKQTMGAQCIKRPNFNHKNRSK